MRLARGGEAGISLSSVMRHVGLSRQSGASHRGETLLFGRCGSRTVISLLVVGCIYLLSRRQCYGVLRLRSVFFLMNQLFILPTLVCVLIHPYDATLVAQLVRCLLREPEGSSSSLGQVIAFFL